MNRIIFIVVLNLCGLCTNAQSLLGDYLKDVGYDGHHNSIISEAIAPSLTIIRQQYRLELNGEHYGRNNMPYYGESYSLAIKVADGIFYLKDVQKPWMYDPDYKRVNAYGNYKTEHFATLQRELRDSVYTEVNLEMGKPDYSYPVNTDSTLYKYRYPRNNFGLSIDETFGDKNGYMLWVRTRTNVKDSAMVADISQSAYTVNACADSMIIAMSPNEPEKIIGGLYVVPKYEQGGRVQFLIAGVAVKTGESEWKLQLLAKALNTVKSSKTQRSKQASDNVSDAEPTPVKKK